MLDGIAYQLESGTLSDSQRNDLLKQQTELQTFLEPTSKKPGAATSLLQASGVFGGNTSLYENLSDNNGDGRVSFADTWLGDFLGADGEGFGIQSKDDEGNRLTLGGNRYRGSSTYEGDKEKAAARRKALIEAAKKYKEPTGAEIAKELTKGTQNIQQNKLNALAAKAKSMNLKSKIDNNHQLTEAEQATYNKAVGEGLGWMF